MAQILLSEIGITDIRGRVGGSQFTRVRSGNQVIKPTIPRQAKSSYQQIRQRNFRAVLGEWQDLDNTERSSWETAAALPEWERLNKVGEPYQPTGQSLFIQLNLAAYDTEFPIRSAPTYPTFTALTYTGGGAQTNGSVRLTFSPTSISSGESIVVFATGNMSPGRTSGIQQHYAELGQYPGPSLNPSLQVGTEWLARWGTPIEGMAIFVKAFLQEIASGARQDLGFQRFIVTV